MPDRHRDGVMIRDPRCQRCNRHRSESCHHRKLRSQQGPDTPENRAGVCGSGSTGCHGWIHAHPEQARRLGYIVPSWADPAAWPMWSEMYAIWILIDAEYCWRPWDGEDHPAGPGYTEGLPIYTDGVPVAYD